MTITPHHSSRHGATVDTIVLHYTAGGGTATSTADYMIRAGNSAHAIIDRGGDIVEPVPDSRAAWHAGDHNRLRTRGSRIPTAGQLSDLVAGSESIIPIGAVPYVSRDVNRRSYGIELVNLGWAYADKPDACKARHRNPASRDDDWQPYTGAQIDALIQHVERVCARIPTIRFACGHEDVTHADSMGDDWRTLELERKIGAKLDPGPAFPWSLLPHKLIRVQYDFARHGWVLA